MNSARVTAMRQGVAYIRGQQQPDGRFDSFSSPVTTPFKPKFTYQTTFAPALILAALSHNHIEGAQDVCSKLGAWLLGEHSSAWSFNYWATSAPERKSLPYPDDLDDTFCALIALYQYDSSVIDQTCLAKVVRLLVATESQVGGPYRTWLAAKSAPRAWKDIDLAVNANVAGFLRLVAEPLPNIVRLIEQAIADESFRSPYYPSPYSIVYYIARAYDGPLVPKLADYLISRQHGGWWGSPLQTALAVTSLARLGRSDACSKALGRLLASQQPDGSWPAEAFCVDPAIQGQTHYNGAATLTTALVLEALQTYAPKQRARSKETATDKFLQQPYSQIISTAKAEISQLDPALRQSMESVLARTQAGDNGQEIVLLPHLFNTSLINPAPDNLLGSLGLANLYGWMAYTVYDDFLDDEGKPELLSAANVAMRQSFTYFMKILPANTGYADFVQQTFNRIDAANAWEVAHCRTLVSKQGVTIRNLPKYPSTLYLSERSLGHTLPVLGVLAASGVLPTSEPARQIQLALRHYITARQLNDDLHDWEQDLRAGIITYVVTHILQESATLPSTYTLAKLVPKLQKHFWHHTLPATCAVITRHTALARRAARASGLLKEPDLVTNLTQRIDASVDNTIAEQSKAEAFLSAYSS